MFNNRSLYPTFSSTQSGKPAFFFFVFSYSSPPLLFIVSATCCHRGDALVCDALIPDLLLGTDQTKKNA